MRGLKKGGDARARGAYGTATRDLMRRKASSFIDRLKAESAPVAS